jgi:hypothetical protein
MEWQGNDLLLFFGEILAARRVGKTWFSYLPIGVTDLPDGTVSITKVAVEDLKQKQQEALNQILAGKTRKQAFKVMKKLGFGEPEPVSIGEAYHDAVRRNDDPGEIAWLKEQWLKEKGTVQ